MKLTKETKEVIIDHFAGGCTGVVTDFFHWDTGELLATQDQVAELLDAEEVHLCEVCGWWSHPGENFLGHAEDCECPSHICGNCCPGHEEE